MLSCNLRIPTFIVIASIVCQYVDGSALLPSREIVGRASETCQPVKILPQVSPKRLSRRDIGSANVEEYDDSHILRSVPNDNANDNGNHLRRRALPSDGPGSRQALISGGARLWLELQDRLHKPTGDANGLCDGFDSRWDTYSFAPNLEEIWPRLVPDVDFDKILDFESYRVVPKGQSSEAVDDDQEIHYENLFSPRQKTIIVVDVRSKKGVDEIGLFYETAKDHWSIAAFLGWTTACKIQQKPLTDIKYILVDSVVNPVTVEAMLEVLNTLPWESGDGGVKVRKKVLTPRDGDTFLMMLKTPNLVGVMHLLSDFVNTLGRKTITKIGMAEHDDPLRSSSTLWLWATLEREPDFGPGGQPSDGDDLSLSLNRLNLNPGGDKIVETS